jgi:hypothetical protein
MGYTNLKVQTAGSGLTAGQKEKKNDRHSQGNR